MRGCGNVVGRNFHLEYSQVAMNIMVIVVIYMKMSKVRECAYSSECCWSGKVETARGASFAMLAAS